MNTKIYANDIKDDTLKQFREAMAQKCNIKGALMSDAHTGYTLPIGAVIRSKNVIFPAYVGYDIGCGVCAAKLDILASDIDLKALKDEILSRIPLSNHEKEQSVELLPCRDIAKTAFGASGKYQLGTLGSGNHFIEVAKGEDEKLWLVIHSGSRGFGKIIAEYYMKKACEMKFDKKACEKDGKDDKETDGCEEDARRRRVASQGQDHREISGKEVHGARFHGSSARSAEEPVRHRHRE